MCPATDQFHPLVPAGAIRGGYIELNRFVGLRNEDHRGIMPRLRGRGTACGPRHGYMNSNFISRVGHGIELYGDGTMRLVAGVGDEQHVAFKIDRGQRLDHVRQLVQPRVPILRRSNHEVRSRIGQPERGRHGQNLKVDFSVFGGRARAEHPHDQDDGNRPKRIVLLVHRAVPGT